MPEAVSGMASTTCMLFKPLHALRTKDVFPEPDVGTAWCKANASAVSAYTNGLLSWMNLCL
jgi:hypothetical protein